MEQKQAPMQRVVRVQKIGSQEKATEKKVIKEKTTKFAPLHHATPLQYAERLFGYIFFAIVLVFSVYLSGVQVVPIFNVFLGFSPIFLTIILSYVMVDLSGGRLRVATWILPVIFSVGFYLFGVSGTPITQNMDIDGITIFNFVVSVFFVILFSSINDIGVVLKKALGKKEVIEETVRHAISTKEFAAEHQLEQYQMEPRKQIERFIQSIEDTSKALNFVIGRVYSNKHGASPEFRDKIKIDKAWYNEFTNINKQDVHERLRIAWKILSLIRDRLTLWHKKEIDVFGIKCSDFKNLKRDELGKSRIIDVLIANDKDPVETYYKSAVDFVNRAFQTFTRFE